MRSPTGFPSPKCCCNCHKHSKGNKQTTGDDAQYNQRNYERIVFLQRENLEFKKVILNLTQKNEQFKSALEKCLKQFADLSNNFQDLFELAHVTSNTNGLCNGDDAQLFPSVVNGPLRVRKQIHIEPLNMRELEEETRDLDDVYFPNRNSLSTILEQDTLENLSLSERLKSLRSLTPQKPEKDAYVKLTRLSDNQPVDNLLNEEPTCSSTPNLAQIRMLRELSLTPTFTLKPSTNSPARCSLFITKTRGKFVRTSEPHQFSPAVKKQKKSDSFSKTSDNTSKSSVKKSLDATRNFDETKRASTHTKASKGLKRKFAIVAETSSHSEKLPDYVLSPISSSIMNLSTTNRNELSPSYSEKIKNSTKVTQRNKPVLPKQSRKSTKHRKSSNTNCNGSSKFDKSVGVTQQNGGDEIKSISGKKSETSKKQIQQNSSSGNEIRPSKNKSYRSSDESNTSQNSNSKFRNKKGEPRLKTMKRVVANRKNKPKLDGGEEASERVKFSRSTKPVCLKEPSLVKKLRG